jgi:hypothetical protein
LAALGSHSDGGRDLITYVVRSYKLRFPLGKAGEQEPGLIGIFFVSEMPFGGYRSVDY